MKLPNWIEVWQSRPPGNYTAAEYTVRVRKWHPGYWAYWLRSLRGLTFTITLGRRSEDAS